MTGQHPTPPDVDDIPLLDRARAAVPELARLVEAVGQVDARRTAASMRAVVAGHDLHNSIAVATTAVIVGGGTIPGDLGAQVLAAAYTRDDAAAETAVLDIVAENLDHRTRKLRSAQLDAQLDVLRTEHDNILDRARRALDTLPGIRTPDDAIRADKVPEWRALTEQAARYGELRRAQRVLVSDRLAATDPDHDTGGDHTTPDAEQLVDQHGTIQGSTPAPDDPRPATYAELHGWLTEPHQAPEPPPWATGDPLADLIYAAAHESWLPSGDQLVAARTAHNRARADVPATAEQAALLTHGLGHGRLNTIR